MNAMRLSFVLLVAALALVALAAPASAHASANTADGKYRITWGLLDEPGYTFTKNKLDLIVRELAPTATNANATGAGVNGLSGANLTVQLKYLDLIYEWGNITQNTGVKGGSFAGSTAPNGNYTSSRSIVLTQPGIYSLVVRGDIRGTPVDMEIPAAHEYEALQDVMFPAEVELGGAGDASALTARIAALESKVSQLESKLATQAATPTAVVTQTPGATSGAPVPGFGVLLAALAVVGAALLLRRKA